MTSLICHTTLSDWWSCSRILRGSSKSSLRLAKFSNGLRVFWQRASVYTRPIKGFINDSPQIICVFAIGLVAISLATGSNYRGDVMKKTIATMGASAFVAASSLIGAPLAMKHEGLSLKPYYDVVGVKTWCYGETEKGYKESFTKKECDDLFAIRYGAYSWATRWFYNSTGEATVTPHAHAAFTYMSYNVGLGAVRRSSMIRLANQGDLVGACNSILLYKRAGKIKDCSKTKGMRKGCYGVWQTRLDMNKICLTGL